MTKLSQLLFLGPHLIFKQCFMFLDQQSIREKCSFIELKYKTPIRKKNRLSLLAKGIQK